jgi:hypothetical protein
MAASDSTEDRGDAHRHSRRAVLGAAATLGVLAPAAPAALAAGIGGRRAVRPPAGQPTAAGQHTDGSVAGQGAVPGEEDPSEVWGTSASGRGAGVRGNGRWGVVGEGTHSGVTGDGFVGVRGTTSIVDGDERGTGVWAQAAAPGSTALRADGPSEFNGVTTFSRSGVARIRRGSASLPVTGVSLTADSAILATLQDREPGVYLHAVEIDAAAGAFTVFLTAAAPRDMLVGWFALG